MASSPPPAAAATDAPGPEPASEGASPRTALIALLRSGGGGGERIAALIEQVEREQPADLRTDTPLVEGVWELRWSSSSLPYLATAAWITNLQVLAPSRGQGMNLLRLAGPLGDLAGIAVRAAIAIEPPAAPDQPSQRVSVRFQEGGWLGPKLGGQRLKLLRQVQQSFPAWLDITVVDQELRLCRGNAGTVFALLRRPDLSVAELLG
ncbi:MAG: PAP/fibrillin family protein [Cyanobacteriota bacterium]|nr:PAP/fibrillin family protein [Cyanobacteriota bacterium]